MQKATYGPVIRQMVNLTKEVQAPPENSSVVACQISILWICDRQNSHIVKIAPPKPRNKRTSDLKVGRSVYCAIMAPNSPCMQSAVHSSNRRYRLTKHRNHTNTNKKGTPESIPYQKIINNSFYILKRLPHPDLPISDVDIPEFRNGSSRQARSRPPGPLSYVPAGLWQWECRWPACLRAGWLRARRR